ncbi:MAG: hypothetical protein COW59_06480 [Lysobacterales bacterium CG17_big_fil_post_rev_8_21_14_2_50_64_11]|nr:MAG: hypothetical protein COW59_06480 [Xanthomonadales bacterium CG17_big_fil_post_rev_8_21_14_2_50_64_11]PIX60529.1 MAG: hypothetical protein COZ47_06685 [Xanthomonadales bacterium CG_4_10_14_3_um_filter_64_11]
MNTRDTGIRYALIAVIAVTLVATSGCGWFRSKKDPYKNAAENRPLEVPPDLDRPRVDAAMQIPAVRSRAASDTAAAGASISAAPQALISDGQFVLADTLDSAWRRVGLALERMDGVTVGTRSQALGTTEVAYKGQTFLVRLRAQDESTEISAVATDGRSLAGGPAAELLALLKTRLG